MKVKKLSVIGDDPRFTFDTSTAAKISPGQKSYVGTVKFDPGADCDPDEDCYTGFSPDSKFGRPWYLGLAMPLNLGEMDLALVHSLWNRMKAVSSPNAIFNVTLKLDTSEVRGFLFSARASLSWPVISSSTVIKYPLTQLGNSTKKHVIISNPSFKPLLVHIVPMSSYPDATSVINLLPQRKTHNLSPDTVLDPADASLFTIESVTDVDNPDEPLDTFGDNFSEKFGVEVSTSTHPVILKPGQSAKVIVSFTPVEAAGSRASVLFVRNNLTGVDVVDLVGAGAVGDIKFGNRRPGSVIHAFEVTEKHLKDCEKAATSKQPNILPNLTVKRPFTARNSGEVSIWVTSFEIDGKTCEGYGFKVLDCEPFLLAANDSKKINIAFTPDFTLSRVTRTLTLKTSLGDRPGQGDVKYSLAASVPSHLLSLCSKALPRPYWEKMIYYGTLSLLTAGFCCVMIAAFFEADRILKFCFLMASPTQQSFLAENCKPFDLKEIARTAILESEKRIEAAEIERNNSSSSNRLAPTSKMISSQNYSNLELLKKDSSLAFLNSIQDLKTNNNDVSNTQKPKFSMIKKFASVLRFLFRTVFKPTESISAPATESPKTIEKIHEAIKEIKETKKVDVPPVVSKKSPDVKKSKTGNKKSAASAVVKPKLATQNSVQDEVETSSTTTESSNAEELTETFSKGITNTNTNVLDCSPAQENSKKKKKTQKPKPEETTVKENNNKQNPKKKIEKQESIKQEPKPEKPKLIPKNSTDSPKVCNVSVKTESPPPPQVKQKQEAKVKGVPKEVTELRRQQSAPAYDRPPRLQTQVPGRQSQDNYGGHAQGHMDGFPTVTTMQKPDPPRAIILPELKQNPGSQFGPIAKPTKSTWNDSPAAPNPVQPRLLQSPNSPPPQPSLLPPPGLTIMQQLQAERRQREEEYVRRQNNWPGFNDTNPPNTGIVGGTTNYVENLWDAPSQSSGLWGTLDNVWPSSVFNNSGFNDGRNMNRENENALGFDSLSLSSIWSSASPPHQDEGENTWSSLFSENKKDI